MKKIIAYIKCYFGFHSPMELGRSCYWIDDKFLSEHPELCDQECSDRRKAIMCEYCRKML